MAWYTFDTLEAKHCLFNFINSSRSAGKTFAMKVRMVEKYLNEGKTCVYMRRRATEMRASTLRNFFTKPQQKGLIPDDLEFSVQDGNIYTRHCGDEEWSLMVNCVCLSTANNSRSEDFIDVSDIYFEEYCLLEDEQHKYLKNEVTRFLELYVTISRFEDVKVWFIGNMIQLYNPYFLYFDLKPSYDKITVKNDIAVQFWKNTEFTEQTLNTRFGRMVKNTTYGDYLLDNQSLETNVNMIKKTPKGCTPVFDFYYCNKYYGVWEKNSYMYFSKIPTRKFLVAMSGADNTKGALTPKGFRTLPMYKRYKTAAIYNRLFYDTAKEEQVGRLINRELLCR